MNAQVEPKQEHDAEPNFQLPIKDYHQFYRFYLTEHRNIMSRRLHVAGSSIGLYFFSKAILKRKPRYFIYGLVSGYACAWVGHFVFEKISQPVLNSLCIVLFLTGACFPMFYVEI